MSEYKTVNIEEGRPTSDLAIRRLTYEIKNSKRLGYKAIKVIHGYGSSGAGGKIRIEARNYLLRLHTRREIQAFIPGEYFSIFDSDTRTALDICPEIRSDSDLERHNNGITVIIF